MTEDSYAIAHIRGGQKWGASGTKTVTDEENKYIYSILSTVANSLVKVRKLYEQGAFVCSGR